LLHTSLYVLRDRHIVLILQANYRTRREPSYV